MSVKVFDFLMLFIESDEQLVNKEDAIEIIWLGNEGVGKRGVTNAIWTLRKAFIELGIEQEVFQTLPKVGYKLALSVKPADSEVTPSHSSAYTSAKRSLWPWAAMALLVTIAALFAFLFLKDAQVPSHNQLTEIAVTTFEGIEEHPAVSHDGKYLAFQWLREGSKSQIYLKNLVDENAALNLISMSDQEETSPAWSITDDRLAYIRLMDNGGCELRVREIVTNKDTLVGTGCFYSPYRNIITWSNQPEQDFLVYAKQVAGAVALFKYDFATQSHTQMTFPQVYESDFAPELSADNKELIFIREKGQQNYDLLRVSKEKVDSILSGLISIVGIALDHQDSSVIVNYSKSGQFVIDKVDLESKAISRIANRRLPSNISLNSKTNQLFISDHISKEYIGLTNVNTGKVTRRVSSSSRDMYGRYLTQSDQILFLSNRSGMWSIWLKSKLNSINLTGELGNVTVPAISPDESQYVVKISSTENNSASLYLGTLSNKQLQKLDTKGLQVENLSWSQDGEAIYFFSSEGENAGIYRLHLSTSEIVQLTSSNEQYAIEAGDGSLYVSRLNQSGIWQFNPKTSAYKLVTSELDSGDYGSFYVSQNKLYYLYRNKFTDEVKSINDAGVTEVIASFPRNTVRKYFGISKGANDNFLATLKITNEADINGLPILVE